MAIKHGEVDAIHAVLQAFDREWRDAREYAGWEENKNYLHALHQDGKLYHRRW